MTDITRPTVMEIDLDAFISNINNVKKFIGNNIEIMPIIKANAYGTYINTRLDILNKFNIVGVATVDEGVYIRDLGYKNDIFILNQPYTSEIEKIIKNNLIIGISSFPFLSALKEDGRNIKIHIEIDSGMGRTGILYNDIKKFIKEINSCKNIVVDGLYTHLSSPDTDIDYTKQQLNLFDKTVDICKNELPNIRYIHAASSTAIIDFKNSQYNLIRPGLILYGYESRYQLSKKIPLSPVSKLKSKIILLKTVPIGTSIGYGRCHITKRETKVATIPMGYIDGLKRSLSNNWYVYINGRKAPIIGKICMDIFMADVTDIENVNIGDEVIIWDNKNITLDKIAKQCDTINYEILSTISDRVPRIFIKNND